MKNVGLQAGFARVNINPPLGIDINGYYVKRYATGILDDLEANAVALKNGDKSTLLMSLDNLGTDVNYLEIRQEIEKRTGIPVDAIFIHCTHTHTAPSSVVKTEDTEEGKKIAKLSSDYRNFLFFRCVDVATMAVADLKPAKMGYGIGLAPNVAFIRRYRMKDGSVKTNPGVLNPDIVHPIGQVDENFYVNISSQEMGFYDNSDKENPNQKVVSIGNNSATIKKPIFKEDAKFENNATFEQQVNMYKPNTTTGFIFKLEENGSLSLAISK